MADSDQEPPLFEPTARQVGSSAEEGTTQVHCFTEEPSSSLDYGALTVHQDPLGAEWLEDLLVSITEEAANQALVGSDEQQDEDANDDEEHSSLLLNKEEPKEDEEQVEAQPSTVNFDPPETSNAAVVVKSETFLTHYSPERGDGVFWVKCKHEDADEALVLVYADSRVDDTNDQLPPTNNDGMSLSKSMGCNDIQDQCAPSSTMEGATVVSCDYSELDVPHVEVATEAQNEETPKDNEKKAGDDLYASITSPSEASLVAHEEVSSEGEKKDGCELTCAAEKHDEKEDQPGQVKKQTTKDDQGMNTKSGDEVETLQPPSLCTLESKSAETLSSAEGSPMNILLLGSDHDDDDGVWIEEEALKDDAVTPDAEERHFEPPGESALQQGPFPIFREFQLEPAGDIAWTTNDDDDLDDSSLSDGSAYAQLDLSGGVVLKNGGNFHVGQPGLVVELQDYNAAQQLGFIHGKPEATGVYLNGDLELGVPVPANETMSETEHSQESEPLLLCPRISCKKSRDECLGAMFRAPRWIKISLLVTFFFLVIMLVLISATVVVTRNRQQSVLPETKAWTPPVAAEPECKDSREFFRVNGEVRDCEWLSSSKAFQLILCNIHHVANTICVETCGHCPDNDANIFDFSGNLQP